ncbi:unnamed protein product [Arabidopsis thaliana]|uniref:At2g29880-like C-terminal domain-containing protein n=1 Tax=Arabidopsis thaliana TaxID=3702 RepID=A0A654G4Z4_ARATH|nr:unnamed protein product [Arabidopsis thaliana]
MIFGLNVATGQNVVGLGDSIVVDASQVGDDDGPHDLSHVQILDDMGGSHDVFSSLEKRRAESMQVQARWEKEAEEKEVEDKANNVWDAIKEISDLDADLCYETMTLVDSLGMKSGFVHMSTEQHKGWIMRSLRK